MSQLVESLNRFSLATLQLTNTEDNKQNTVFSPYSAFVCVSMSAPLFKEETRAEILKSLQISVDQSQVDTVLQQLRDLINKENTEEVSSSNRIWANQIFNFSPETFAPSEKILGIPIEKVNFPQPACDQINQEVNRATKGMIPKLVEESDVGPDSAIVLLNAIYFKAEWEKKFDIDPSSNSPENKNFTLADGTKIHACMLRSFKRDLPYAEDDKFKVLSIPYLKNKYDFVIVLPKDDSVNGYDELTKLTYDQLNNDYLTKLGKRKVNILLPKFTFESKTQLNGIFRSLGLNKAFTHDAQCTDPNISYFITSIIQKAKIILDENGTEAAAATGMMMRMMRPAAPEPITNVYADHPFIYLLRNKQTNSILFEGFVKNPSS